MEELTNLKKIAEKQLEEALESLQAEREQRFLKSLKMFKFLCCSRCSSFYIVLVVQDVLYSRYALKKELDSKNNSESMYQLGNLALSIQVVAKSKIEKSRSNIFSESTHSQLQQLNCLARQQASVLVQLRQQRRSTKCPKFLPPSDRFCQKSSNFDCVDSVSSSARALKDRMLSTIELSAPEHLFFL